MKNLIGFLIGLLVVGSLVLVFISCGSSSGVPAARETEGGGGTVTITGTLQYTAGEADISKSVRTKATAAESYRTFIVNASTGAQAVDTVDADGAFDFTLSAESSYMISFVDDDLNYVGTLAVGSVGEDNTVPVALMTGIDGETEDLGTITANTSTGQVTSDATLTADDTHLAATSGGIIAGGKSGEGSTNYDSTTVTDDIADSSDPDDDNDGVPDIFDSDNDNDGYADEIDGTQDYCAGGQISLYISNYPGSLAANAQQEQFPKPSEIDASLGTGTMYVIHLEVEPLEGESIDDISSVTVTPPDYINTYGTIYEILELGDTCFNELWSECSTHPNKLFLSEDGTKYEIGLARNTSIYINEAPILEHMFPGDTYILNIAMAGGTSHICTKKINIIPKYFAYNFKKDGALVDPSEVVRFTGWSGSVTFSWSIPSVADGDENAVGPAGMTYKLGFVPYDASCSPDAENEGFITAGQDVTSKTVTIPDDVDAVADSPINVWSLKIYSVDDIGDSSYTGGIQFTSEAESPAPCGP